VFSWTSQAEAGVWAMAAAAKRREARIVYFMMIDVGRRIDEVANFVNV
jgi:hypothetical protein